jgi:hypothetical protein
VGLTVAVIQGKGAGGGGNGPLHHLRRKEESHSGRIKGEASRQQAFPQSCSPHLNPNLAQDTLGFSQNLLD